jgi:YidC/Oxa1 family membrane protein insertase
MNKRLFIALLLSMMVLAIYGSLMPKKSVVEQNKTAVTSAQEAPKAPVVKSSSDKNLQVPSSVKVSNGKIIATVETKKYILKFDNLGRFDSVILKEKKYRTDDGKPLDLIAKNLIKPLEVRFEDRKINNLASVKDYTASVKELNASTKSGTITLEQNLDGVTLKKIITFYPNGNYDLDIKVSDSNLKYSITPGFRPIADKSNYMAVRGVLLRKADGVVETIEDGDANKIVVYNDITVTAAVDRYYTTLFFKKDNSTMSTTVGPSGLPDHEKDPIAFVHSQGDSFLNGYIGPKEYKLFVSLDSKLEDVVEFGWFTFLAKPFFKIMLAIYDFVGNWGWAIIIFTILVKLVLFPLSYKGLMSMQKLRDLAPKMKEIRERYKDDPMKMNQQMMELYKRHGANPMGGCLPMLIQIPIFFALYRVLLNADELQGAPWILWITDLSRPDPYYILPLLMGATMYIQQKLTPNTMTDPMQQKIFNWLPAIMTLFFIAFPSGLVLYWLVNNILTIIQQLYVNRAYEQYKARLKKEKSEKSKSGKRKKK